jgi:hypothetical protein
MALRRKVLTKTNQRIIVAETTLACLPPRRARCNARELLRMLMTAKLSPEAFLSDHFGPFAVAIWRLPPAIEAATKNQTYAFMDLDTYSALVRENAEEAQAIYWREMLLRIHLACCISLRRHSAWLHSLLFAFEAKSLFGVCAAYRGFLESAADSLYSLGAAPTMLASNLTAIIHRLKKRRIDTVIVSKELEDRLIHFTHGRKLERGESADPGARRKANP